MKPVIKYQGGKTRELKTINTMLPCNYERVVEPFCGGAALSFSLGKPAVLTDINHQVINLYRVIADDNLYPKLQEVVDLYKTYDHDKLSPIYYDARSVINQNNEDNDPLTKAISYIVVRQLCFSGMERYNSKGEFNVPFGHYKSMPCNLSYEHHKYLKTCDIKQESFVNLFNRIASNDFVFLDPPYLDKLGYTQGDGGEKLHTDLLECCKTTNASWLIIHSDHEFYRDNYKDFFIETKDFNYSQRFGKNKDHSNSKVQHLYISNYPLKEVFNLEEFFLSDED
jgi:DNA adenine methylase